MPLIVQLGFEGVEEYVGDKSKYQPKAIRTSTDDYERKRDIASK